MTSTSIDARIEIVRGDITRLTVDAIVNAANNSLLGGGGVDGAIHRAAGPGLLEECRSLGGCETGMAKMTAGYDLLARWVIHTVGPIWQGGAHDEDRLLADCYANSLGFAPELSIRSMAFPSISTGAYRFPVERASTIAIGAIKRHLALNALPERVIIVCFDDRTLRVYERALHES